MVSGFGEPIFHATEAPRTPPATLSPSMEFASSLQELEMRKPLNGSDPNGGSRAPKSLMTNHLPLSLIELLRRCSRWSVLGVEYWSGKKASGA